MHCVISWSCDFFYILNDTYRKQRVGEHRKCTTRTRLRWTHTTEHFCGGYIYSQNISWHQSCTEALLCLSKLRGFGTQLVYSFLELWLFMQCYANNVQFCDSLHICNTSSLLKLLWSTKSHSHAGLWEWDPFWYWFMRGNLDLVPMYPPSHATIITVYMLKC